MGIELAAFVALHRAQTMAQARAALGTTPLIVAFVTTIVLAINGPLTNGKRGEGLYRLAQGATDGPLTSELETARGDRVLNYSVFMTACELVAALYIMSNKPGLVGSLLTVAIAALVAVVPMLVTRRAAPKTAPNP